VPPQGYLLISRGGKVLSRVTLGQRTLLGRSEHNDVCLPSPYLSRHHAAIVGTPEGYYVVDLNSVNDSRDQITLGPPRRALRRGRLVSVYLTFHFTSTLAVVPTFCSITSTSPCSISSFESSRFWILNFTLTCSVG